jgi:hypothetical protein
MRQNEMTAVSSSRCFENFTLVPDELFCLVSQNDSFHCVGQASGRAGARAAWASAHFARLDVAAAEADLLFRPVVLEPARLDSARAEPRSKRYHEHHLHEIPDQLERWRLANERRRR